MSGSIVYLLVVILGYCLGSLPTAYLLVKRKSRIDIRLAGSGNVGGLNAFEISNSYVLGATVVLVDILKGCIAVVLAGLFFGWKFMPMSVAGLSAIAGHNYPVWLTFHGGRGLATAAGTMLILCWCIVLVWVTAWGITYAYSRKLHLSNIIATICLPVVAGFLPDTISRFTLGNNSSPSGIFIVVLILSVLLLLTHKEHIRELLSSHHNG